MSNPENILGSIPGYILNPAGTYEKNRNQDSSRAIAMLIILDAAICLLSGLILVIYDILSGRSSGPQFLLPGSGLYILVRFIIEILIIVSVVHFTSKYENREAKFADSFKISLVSYTYYIVIIAIFNLINVLYTAGMNYDAGSLTYFVGYLLFILALLFFVRVSAEGIKVLHGLSGVKAYLIGIISILSAKIVVYLGSSWIMAFSLFIGL